jgi:hypothetical protein
VGKGGGGASSSLYNNTNHKPIMRNGPQLNKILNYFSLINFK